MTAANTSCGPGENSQRGSGLPADAESGGFPVRQMVSVALAFPPADDEPIEAEEVKVTSWHTASGPLARRPQNFARRWSLQRTAVRLARIHARTWLTTWRWAGDLDEALIVVVVLMDNAVKYAAAANAQGCVELALVLDEDENLVICVSDPNPKFEGFTEAVAAEKRSGLGLVRALGGEITWGTPDVDSGKTVQVRMQSADR
ncbi:ATP-binding protein [Streptomyces sp. NPDC057002]|uniref:ATP-binding protein n=1 Tax=Streptomyces sp. NPDC057002 TaxID=3345992 RepID=UPI00362B60C2